MCGLVYRMGFESIARENFLTIRTNKKGGIMKTLTFRKLILLVVLISGCCVLYGKNSEVKFTPEPIKGLNADHTKGDWDFMGHGPHVVARADLSNTEEEIAVKLYLCATETQSDWTTFEKTWDTILWRVPNGYTIEKITTPLSSYADYTDRDDKLNSPRVEGNLVQIFEIMGDQLGNDHPFMNVYFKEISVTIKSNN